MKRLLIVYNPRSSRYVDVREEVLEPARDLSGYMVGKYEIENTDVEQNVAKLAKLLEKGDRVISAGGDATAVIAVNAIIQSAKDVELAVLPYGNFNDLARTLNTRTLDDALRNQVQKLHPLRITVDGKHWRYATCYVTIGLTAEAVKLYDTPRVRKKLKTKFGRMVKSYTLLAQWYFEHRRGREFIPRFMLNGVLQDERVSNYAAVNGGSMARVMRGGDDWKQKKEFRSGVDKLTSLWRLSKMMIASMLKRVPGKETTGDTLEFVRPGDVVVQAEGESRKFVGVKEIKINKTGEWIKVVVR